MGKWRCKAPALSWLSRPLAKGRAVMNQGLLGLLCMAMGRIALQVVTILVAVLSRRRTESQSNLRTSLLQRLCIRRHHSRSRQRRFTLPPPRRPRHVRPQTLLYLEQQMQTSIARSLLQSQPQARWPWPRRPWSPLKSNRGTRAGIGRSRYDGKRRWPRLRRKEQQQGRQQRWQHVRRHVRQASRGD